MANLETSYLGINLKNPIIVSSSGLTREVQGVKRAYEAGAGAVVLKSLFEEQILAEAFSKDSNHPEEYDYLMEYGTHTYLKLIEDCKKAVDIPVIASVNCVTQSN